jgi:cytochrome c oxidase subunit 3
MIMENTPTNKKNPFAAEQFEDAPQQVEAAQLGMWIFLATEVLFFGGLFFCYTIYRHFYEADFMVGVKHTLLLYGTINSVLLLTSGLTVALAVQAADENRNQVIFPLLLATIFFGAAFLVVKAFEYAEDISEKVVPGPNFDPSLPLHTQIFFWLYWAMTGLHTIHLIVGIGVLLVIALMARQGRFSAKYYTPLEIAALYWAFVDIVWIFLYPLLYLIGRHS